MVKNLEEKNTIDEFRDILSHWINVYKWQNCSYFAIKTPRRLKGDLNEAKING